MKKNVWIFIALFFAVCLANGTENLKKLDIYLLIGQSNMAGRAPMQKEDKNIIDHCFLLNGQDKWEDAKNPLNRYSTIRKGLGMQKLGPGYTFAQDMLKADKKSRIGLVVNAKGGSKIAAWKKGTKFYNEAVRRTKIAMKSGKLRGILWLQGEADQKNQNYLVELKQFIADLRNEFGNAKLPFIAGEVNNVPLVNGFINRLPKEVPYTGAVSVKGMKAMDRWHWDNPSVKTIGKRFAKEMQKLQKK